MKNAKIYLAGPLFNNAERKENEEVYNLLTKEGFKCYLPQKEFLLDSETKKGEKLECFLTDYNAISESDIVIANLNGVDVDSGTASEIGIALQLYYDGRLSFKPFGYRSDFRTYNPTSEINNFVQGCLYEGKIFNDINDITEIITTSNYETKHKLLYLTKVYN